MRAQKGGSQYRHMMLHPQGDLLTHKHENSSDAMSETIKGREPVTAHDASPSGGPPDTQT